MRHPSVTVGLDRAITLVILTIGALASTVAVAIQGVDARPELITGAIAFGALAVLLWRFWIPLPAGKIGLLVVGVAVTHGRVYQALYLALQEGGLEDKLIPAGPWVILLTCLAILLFRNQWGEFASLGLWAASATAVLVFLALNRWPLDGRLRVELVNQYILAHFAFVAAMLFWSRLWLELLESKSQLATQEVLARTDALTELGNRRAAEETLRRMIHHCLVRGIDLGVVLFDIDRFRRVNDRFGPATGDRVLRRVAEIAGGALRPWDRLFRWSDDELLAIAQKADVATARQVAERLGERVGQDRSMPVRLTISAGVTAIDLGDDVDRVLERAGRALAAAKEAGHGRVASLTAEQPRVRDPAAEAGGAARG